MRTCDTERSSEEQPPGGPLLALSRVRTDAPGRKPGLQQGGLKLRSRIVGSDAGCYNHTPSPPPLLPPPTHPLPLPHLSILLDLLPSTPLPPPPLCKLLFYWMAAHSVANQEHSSPMRWHERPTLRSSFTILRTASSRPRPRWSNRQSCCSGRRWSMQKT